MIDTYLSSSPDNHTVLTFVQTHDLSMSTLEDTVSSQMGPLPPYPLHAAQELNMSLSPPLTFMTWNVRGIRSRLTNIQPLLQAVCPAVCIFIETKLRPCQHHQQWLRNSMPEYTLIFNSFPSPAGCAKAGVLIALHPRLSQSHISIVHKTPPHLHGYLAHLQLNLPESKPLHILGVYQETDSLSRSRIQDSIFEYITNLTPDGYATPTDNVLIGGDFNATLYDSDRTSHLCSSFDRRYRQHVHDARLDTAFTDHPGPRSHSYSQDTFSSPSTSRIDDWLCTHGTIAHHIIHTQPQTLQSPYIEGSDHLPVLLHVPHATFFACPIPHTPPPQPRPSQFIRPFPKDPLLAWQRLCDATNGNQAHELAAALTNRLAIAQEDPAIIITAAECQQWHDDIFACIQASFQLAFDTLPMTQEYTPSGSAARHTSYFPRKLMRRFTRHVTNAQAFRRLIHTTTQIIAGTSDVTHLRGTSAFRHIRTHFPEISHIPTNTHLLTSAYLPLLRHLLRIEQTEIKDLNRRHVSSLKIAQKKAFDKALHTSPRKMHQQIFHPPRPSAPTPGIIPALNHPLRGLCTDPPSILQCLRFSQQCLMSHKVPKSSAPNFPWEQPRLDSFHLCPRGPGTPLACQLTPSLFQSCLKTCDNNKATGTDKIPNLGSSLNELLRHLPSSHHHLIFTFFRLCWHTGDTPSPWKHSTTILLHKKGNATDPSNYRPIALHRTLYKLWSKTVTTILQDYAEQHGILNDAQEGFRTHRNTARQLQLLTCILEDAKLHGRDLYMLSIDFKSAFNAIDHTRLFLIMERLGFPADAIQVVKALYTDATTSITCSAGTTQPIPIRRGTIQGDTLSPFLFIIFLEPLLRWLKVNDRGYKCASPPPEYPLYAHALAYADDLLILTSELPQLHLQTNKVEHFSIWSGVEVSPPKCLASCILHASERQRAAHNTPTHKRHASPLSPYWGVLSHISPPKTRSNI
jgi:exonuclease III